MTTNPIVDALRETCVVASVRFSALGLTRTDRSASEKVAQDAHAVNGAARVVVSRLAGADEQHRAITQAQHQARVALVRRSMPLGDEDGRRILPNAQFEPFLTDYGAAKRAFDKAMAELAANADDILARAKANIGSLSIEVPTRDELLSAYSMEFKIEEFPTGEFRAYPPQTAEKLRRKHERELARAVEIAQRNTLERFVQPLSHFVEKMQAYDAREQALAAGQEVTRVGTFRDTVVGNIRELHGVLASFNFAGDERLAELNDMLASLVATPAETLRKDPTVRSAAQERAKAALANLESWLAPVQAAAQQVQQAA